MAQCQNKATFRYTWPGKDESFICDEHEEQLRRIADAMGFHCQTIPIVGYEFVKEQCQQQVKVGV
ncbi:MAG: hypothetical protein V3W19_03935 [Desulfatiglandales bacterium]